MPPPPGTPILRCTSLDGLTKSRVLFEAGDTPASMGLEMGTLLVWSTPAVLRIDGLSACGSNGGAAPACGLSRRRSTARAEKNEADGVLPGGSMSCVARVSVGGGPGSRFTGTWAVPVPVPAAGASWLGLAGPGGIGRPFWKFGAAALGLLFSGGGGICLAAGGGFGNRSGLDGVTMDALGPAGNRGLLLLGPLWVFWLLNGVGGCCSF